MTPPPLPWLCPLCDRQLANPRTMAYGCVEALMEAPVGECPMHRTQWAKGWRPGG